MLTCVRHHHADRVNSELFNNLLKKKILIYYINVSKKKKLEHVPEISFVE